MMNKKEGIVIEGYKGTWYVIDTKEVAGHLLYLLEHEQYGEFTNSIIVDYDGKIIAEDVTDGWEDLPNTFVIEVKIKGYLPAVSFPGAYPIYYLTFMDEVLCAKCASEALEDLVEHDIHWEGAPLYCEDCNAEIESAYGDPIYDVENTLNEMRIRLEASEPKDFDDTPDLDAYGDPFED